MLASSLLPAPNPLLLPLWATRGQGPGSHLARPGPDPVQRHLILRAALPSPHCTPFPLHTHTLSPRLRKVQADREGALQGRPGTPSNRPLDKAGLRSATLEGALGSGLREGTGQACRPGQLQRLLHQAGFRDLSLTPVSSSCPSDLLESGRPVNFYQTPLTWSSANKNLGGRFIQVSAARRSPPQPHHLHRPHSSRPEHLPLRGHLRSRDLGPEKPKRNPGPGSLPPHCPTSDPNFPHGWLL